MLCADDKAIWIVSLLVFLYSKFRKHLHVKMFLKIIFKAVITVGTIMRNGMRIDNNICAKKNHIIRSKVVSIYTKNMNIFVQK